MKQWIKDRILVILTGNYFFIKRIIHEELKIKTSERILDLGCGTGILAPLFSPKGYIGIDIDQNLIEYAKKKKPQYSFTIMDASTLQFSHHSFDKILIVGVLHHLNKKQREKTLSRMKRLLKKNGRVLAIEAIPPIHSWNVLGKILRDHDEGHYILNFQDYVALLSKYFLIKKAYKKAGGIFDYGVFVFENSKK